jgi:WD40 repeat protein
MGLREWTGSFGLTTISRAPFTEICSVPPASLPSIQLWTAEEGKVENGGLQSNVEYEDVTVSAEPPRSHLILTVHGIRTYGPWQERLENTLTQAAASQPNRIQLDIRHYRYGFFTVFSFLIPWLRNLAVKQFRSHLSSVFEDGEFDRIDIIGHSFGTFLAIEGLSGLDRSNNVHVHTVILSGSVLSPDYDLSHLIGPGRRIGRVINDCGTRDGVLLLTLLIIGVGMGGRLGLHGFQSRLLTNRYFEFGHSGYFSSDEFVQRWWLPLLLDDKLVEIGPPRREPPPLGDRFWRTLGENGAATTALFYGLLITLIVGSIGFFWREAEQQRFAALQQHARGQASLAQRLFDIGKSDEAMKELTEAVALTKGYSLQQYFPELLSALRTINAEFDVVARLKHRNDNNVVDATFDSTGRRLVTASWDGTAQLYQTTDSAPKWRAALEGHRGQVRRALFSPDGETVVTASMDGAVGIWDADTGKNQLMLKGDGAGIVALAISRDGRKFATGAEDGSVLLWDFKTKKYSKLKGHSKEITAIAFSRDGLLLATSSDDGTARIWNTQNGQLLRPLEGHKSSVTAVSFSRDGKTVLTASIDKSVRFWSVAEGKEIGKVENRYAYFVTIDPTGRYFATAPIPTLRVTDAPAQVWDMSSRSSTATLRNDRGIYLLAFNPEWHGNQIATASEDEIRLWHPGKGRLLKTFRAPVSEGKTSHIGFSTDGTVLVSTHDNGVVRLWDTRPSPRARILDEQTSLNPRFLGRTKIATVSSGGSIQIREFPSLTLLSESRGAWSFVRSIAIGKDNQIVVADANFGVKAAAIWRQSAEEKLSTCQSNGVLQEAILNASGTTVAVGGDSDDPTILLCDVQTSAPPKILRGHEGAISAIAFDGSEQMMASGSVDKTVRIWKLSGDKPGRVLTGHEASVSSVAFSPDDSFVVSGSFDRTARIWDATTEQLRYTLKHEDTVYAVAVDPSGKIIATGGRDRILHLWDATNGNPIGQFRGHEGDIHHILFSPDGGYVLSAGSDDTLRIWKLVPETDLLKWIESVEFN